MKPSIYILSLIIATMGIAGLQAGIPDAVTIIFLWASVVVSTFSAGWRASKKEKTMAVLFASIVAVYLAPTAPMQSGSADRLYLFRLSWFILPVWILMMIHSVSRILPFYQQKASQSATDQRP